MFIFRKISISPEIILEKLNNISGPFDKRTPSELKSLFNISYSSPESLKVLTLGQVSPLRISKENFDFFMTILLGYMKTFPKKQRAFESPFFEVSQWNRKSLVNFFFRSLIIAGYESGVSLSNSVPVITSTGNRHGFHELVISRGDIPICFVRSAKLMLQKSDDPLEQSFISMIFELFSAFHKSPVWPLYGCVSDAKNWIFLKYDGKEFCRTEKIILQLEEESIKKLCRGILYIIDSY